MFHDIRPPLFGGAFWAALAASVVLTILILGTSSIMEGMIFMALHNAGLR